MKDKEKIEEPVSEDMWEASKQYALRQVFASTDAVMTEQAYLDLRLFSGFELAVAHKDGANWQREQFEKNRLKHCDSITNEQAELEQDFIDQHLDKYQRMPTFLDAIEYGMRLQKEQIMKEAVDGIVHHFDGDGLAAIHYNDPKDIPMCYYASASGLEAGDKVKLIIIKEDEQ